MPQGNHPDIVNGALIGVLVVRQIEPEVPAVGDEFLITQGVDDNGNPVELSTPNPDYVPAIPAHNVTLETIRAAVESAGAVIFDCFESGDAPDGQMRVAFQISVAPNQGATPDDLAAEAATRATIDAALAPFAPPT